MVAQDKDFNSMETAAPVRGDSLRIRSAIRSVAEGGGDSRGTNSRLSWAERPLAELGRLSWPIAVSTLSYSVMTLTGTLFVGRLGASALAGVGLGGTVAFSLMCFGFGLLRAVKVLVSQSTGAGRRDDHRVIVAAGLFASAALAVVTIAIGEIVALYLPGVTASAASGDAARQYLRIRLLAAPIALAAVALRETRYGLGDSRSPMTAAILGNLLNVALDALFILVLGWGVAGAALGTIGGQALETWILVTAQRRDGFGWREASARELGAIWQIGAPTGLQFVLESGSFVLLAAILAYLSDADMAAHQIAIQVIHFSFMPAWAVSEATSVLTGQAVGADRDDLVRLVSRKALWAAGAYTGTCGIVYALAGGWLVAPFGADAPTRALAVQLLIVAAIFQIFDAVNVVGRGALRGVGDVRYAAVIGIATAWAMTPPLAWLLGVRMGLGALGGWIGLCLEIIVGAVLLWGRLERGGWRPHAAASRARLSRLPDAPRNVASAPA